MRKAQIFLSYRRDDAAGYARAVYDELARQFGADRVFMDVDDIGAGRAFDEVIQSAMAEARVLLVMIGKRWRGEREGLPPRIDDEADFVRMEVAAGLARGLRVIPLLLDAAAMPTEAELPEVLRPLARRNALEIGNTRFAADVQRLVVALREALGEPASADASAPAVAPAKTTSALGWGLAAAFAAGIGLLAFWLLRAPSAMDNPAARPAASATAVTTRPARPDINGEWQAEVNYDWPNARYIERFVFSGAAGELQGSASFLRVPRGVLEGRVGPDGVQFVTRTREVAGGAGSGIETVHRYRGELAGGEIRFVMQTEGGSGDHLPVEFIARRAAPAAPAATASVR